ncbi:MAG: site-specific integrase [Alphaproteobacteria bacterium]|nr:site-specific integrase [Alphaproteobacteria bacterium]
MPKRATKRLTDDVVRKLPAPGKGATIAYDADVPGFGARVTATGARAFVLNYMSAGRERRMTIGKFPTWSATAAREEARSLRRKVDGGIDPMAERETQDAAAVAERSAPTMQDLFARYEAEHLPRKSPRAAADDRSMWLKIVLPRLGAIKVADVSHSHIDALHAAVSETRPVRANRVIEVVRKAFNMSIRWGWRADNPASGTHRNQEEKRTRYLSPAEVMRLIEALATQRERASANAIKLLMLTGARRGEVLGARWDMFDLEAGVWVKPSSHTKQRKEHRVPLSAPALQVLLGILAAATDEAAAAGKTISPYVFPGHDGKPITDIKRTWLSACRKAGLAEQVPKRDKEGMVISSSDGKPVMVWQTTARIHDLRHTYASILASAGLSLPIIGALLGHTQAQTTARYAHLLDDPLRAATERVGAIVTASRTKGADAASQQKG